MKIRKAPEGKIRKSPEIVKLFSSKLFIKEKRRIQKMKNKPTSLDIKREWDKEWSREGVDGPYHWSSLLLTLSPSTPTVYVVSVSLT